MFLLLHLLFSSTIDNNRQLATISRLAKFDKKTRTSRLAKYNLK